GDGMTGTEQRRPVRFSPPSKTLTGLTAPGRSVCAPGLAVPIITQTGFAWEIRTMGFSSFFRLRKADWFAWHANRSRVVRPKKTSRRLELEQLEDRWLPSVVINEFPLP